MPSNDQPATEPNIAGRLLGTSAFVKGVEDTEKQIKKLGQSLDRMNKAIDSLTGTIQGTGRSAGRFPRANTASRAGLAQAPTQAGGSGFIPPGSAVAVQQADGDRLPVLRPQYLPRLYTTTRPQEPPRVDLTRLDRFPVPWRPLPLAGGGAGGGDDGGPRRGDPERFSFGLGQATNRAMTWGAGKFQRRVDHMTSQAYEMDRYATYAYTQWGDPDKGRWSEKNRLRNDAMHSSTATSTEDLNTGLFEVDRRLGAGRSDAERRILHKQASGYAVLDPSMGMADSAQMMTAMYTPQASMMYQVLGIGPTIGEGGERMSQSQLNENLLNRIYRGGGYSLKNVQADSEQGGALRTTLEAMARAQGQSQDWVENRLTQIQSQAKWQEKTGGSAEEFDKLLQDAGGTGDKAKKARDKLDEGGLDTDNLINQRKRKEGEERRHDSQMMDAFAPALSATTDVVIKFKEALNSVLELPGLKQLIGGYQGVDSGTGGRLSSTLGGAAKGALAGAGIASFVPGIGTAVGAAAGGLIGGLGGLIFGGADGGGGSGGSEQKSTNRTRSNLTQGSANAAIRAALTQIGVDYSWGGGGPDGPSTGIGRGSTTVGFDCSSFMQYAYAKAGIRLGRTTYEQMTQGKGIDYKDRRPGDLMFPNSGHVVMYLGNGKILHAPRSGQKIRIDPESHFGKYIAVRRLVAGGGDTYDGGDGSKSSEAGAGNDNSAKTGASSISAVGDVYGSANEVDVLKAALATSAGSPAGSGSSPKEKSRDENGESGDTSAASMDGSGGSGVQRWKGVVQAVLKQLGEPMNKTSLVLKAMDKESGGNPTIVNKWDSNWVDGTPSVGLMQVIGPTFKENAGPYLHTGPFSYGVSTNAAANIYSAVHYARGRYGSGWAERMAEPRGYAVGAWELPNDEIAQVHKGEMIIPAQQAKTIRQALLQDSIPIKSPAAEAARASASGTSTRGGGVTLHFADGAIRVTVAGGSSGPAAYQMVQQIVDHIAADDRIKKIGAGI
ncbi:NlpC/P60 family protein [Streptomyces sp. UNOC14_S4]|uniref:NlpC/P60 family protein n=1 Tax=Streptomyces sp. UNOC14_S4 TaxID=2872340 RepID=UPI0023B132C8|nr:NlpC/P60 family protein [Streptomyces sp. UNOC14_S4]MCC3766039.1 C40 family peptidase [Streptomyces sp. UNOC14_S4]